MSRRGETLGRMVRECPLCTSRELTYDFIVDGYPVCSCSGCGLLFLNPAPASNVAVGETPADPRFDELHAENARARLELFCKYSGLERGSILCVGCDAALQEQAASMGFRVTTVEPPEFPRFAAQSQSRFDGCISYGFMETVEDPVSALQLLRRLLKDRAPFMAIVTTLDSGTAALFGTQWWEFSSKNRFYFSTDTFQNVLLKGGFGDPVVVPDDSVVSLDYLRRKLESLRSTTKLLPLRLAAKFPVFRDRLFHVRHSRTCFLARPAASPRGRQLSVIVPVYNERATFADVMEMLMAKMADRGDMEIIVVESNSTDGTREIVRQYEGHAGVSIVLQDAPRGKGNAVREGLRHATGEVVIIQDADLEYDLNDYEALLDPILGYRNNFVIGTRHGRHKNVWKIRQFDGARGLSFFFNLGHLFFLVLFNTLYGQQLTDPFSMFKVFRRDCLAGLEFECDRFDFDYELAIKLLRKGYRPIEIPVNYRSRSLAQGKKVTLVRDPLTWLRALWRFRKSPLYAFDKGHTIDP
jgi:hypothetical protein